MCWLLTQCPPNPLGYVVNSRLHNTVTRTTAGAYGNARLFLILGMGAAKSQKERSAFLH